MDDIGSYTIRQMMLFYELGQRRQVRGQREIAVLMRAAYHAEGKDFKKHLNSLEE